MEGEHDLEDAHDRYEKRWMIKENERKAKVGRKKDFVLSCGAVVLSIYGMKHSLFVRSRIPPPPPSIPL